ncbi:hypothetical protein LG198_00605 [Methylobacillus arboreus]|uniref:PEP-CTERM sorting domain-containing protein n=1 Tax=Methylobacillus arboreus TaxID=755170 RepID=UPI001E2A9DE3|nr:PEP-CTERM sorting domain-containing protein [Methylobacillus arboreus]MCB5189233.1 hypothetical protein [Methylobacillus arboreus]
MKNQVMSWFVGALLLVIATVASAATKVDEVGYLYADPSLPSEAVFSYSLDAGVYELSLLDYEFPAAFLPGSFGIEIYTGGSLVSTLYGSGTFLLPELTAGSYLFSVFGDANNDFGFGVFGFTVSPVPEADTWALLAVGIGLLVAYTSRRKTPLIADKT